MAASVANRCPTIPALWPTPSNCGRMLTRLSCFFLTFFTALQPFFSLTGDDTFVVMRIMTEKSWHLLRITPSVDPGIMPFFRLNPSLDPDFPQFALSLDRLIALSRLAQPLTQTNLRLYSGPTKQKFVGISTKKDLTFITVSLRCAHRNDKY